jgi:hypothetical protein
MRKSRLALKLLAREIDATSTTKLPPLIKNSSAPQEAWQEHSFFHSNRDIYHCVNTTLAAATLGLAGIVLLGTSSVVPCPTNAIGKSLLAFVFTMYFLWSVASS